MSGTFKDYFDSAEIIISRQYEIIKADKRVYAYLGSNGALTLDRAIHADDFERIDNALANLKENDKDMIAIRVQYKNTEYHWFLYEISYADNSRQIFKITAYDINALCHRNDRLKTHSECSLEYLSLTNYIYLSYNINNDRFSIFMIGDSKQRLDIFRGSLDDWRKDRLTDGTIDDENSFNELYDLIKRGEPFFERELKFNMIKDIGGGKWSYIKAKTAVIENERIVIGIISTAGDSNDATFDTMAHFSDMKDAGTDLFNKRAITNYAKKLIGSKPNHSITFAVMDIDDFKNVNDTYGHMFGDEVIMRVSEIIKEAVGDKGLCGRIGGDEMFMVMENLDTNDDIRSILRTIKSNVAWLFHDDPRQINKITCSIGAASYPDAGMDYDTLFMVADKMLYLAKRKGKNRYIIYHGDIHSKFVYGGDENVVEESDEKAFYKYRKIPVINNMVNDYIYNKTYTKEELLEMVSLAFGIDSIVIYDGERNERVLLYGKDTISEYDKVFIRKDNFITHFNEDGINVIDNINFFERRYPVFFKAYSDMGINQAVQYMIGGFKESTELTIVSINRFKQGKKWSEMDISYLTIIANIVGTYYNENRHEDI